MMRDVDDRPKLTHWGCGQKLGLLGGSSCIHTKTVFKRLSATSIVRIAIYVTFPVTSAAEK
jgi:hypothetical protein